MTHPVRFADFLTAFFSQEIRFTSFADSLIELQSFKSKRVFMIPVEQLIIAHILRRTN